MSIITQICVPSRHRRGCSIHPCPFTSLRQRYITCSYGETITLGWMSDICGEQGSFKHWCCSKEANISHKHLQQDLSLWNCFFWSHMNLCTKNDKFKPWCFWDNIFTGSGCTDDEGQRDVIKRHCQQASSNALITSSTSLCSCAGR